MRLPQLIEATKGMDGVLHLAALMSITMDRDPWMGLDVNIRGTQNAIEACCINGVKKLVFTSSSAVYGYGPGPEGRSGGDHAVPHVRRAARRDHLRRQQDHRRAALPRRLSPSAGSTTWWCATPPSTASASTTARPTRSTSSRPTTACARVCARASSATARIPSTSCTSAMRRAPMRRPSPPTPPTLRSISRGRKPTTTLEIVRLVTELAGKDLAPEHVEPEAGKVSLTSGGAWKMDHSARRAHHRLAPAGRHARRHQAAARLARSNGEVIPTSVSPDSRCYKLDVIPAEAQHCPGKSARRALPPPVPKARLRHVRGGRTERHGLSSPMATLISPANRRAKSDGVPRWGCLSRARPVTPPDASSDLDRPLRMRRGRRWPIQAADASPSPLVMTKATAFVTGGGKTSAQPKDRGSWRAQVSPVSGMRSCPLAAHLLASAIGGTHVDRCTQECAQGRTRRGRRPGR